MDKTKEKKAKLQIVIAVLVLTIIMFAEIYLMINFPTYYTPIIMLAVVALLAVYVVTNAIMTISTEKEAARNENFENLYRSDKACYIILKKSFDEIEERLNQLQETSKVPTEEIINAQKGIAKVIINRSKENADAIINSNDQVLERLDEVEETQNTKFTNLSKEQRLKLTDIGTQIDLKLQDLLVQLKDTELRINQAIMSGSKVVMQSPVNIAPVEEISQSEEIVVEEEPIILEAEPAVNEEKTIVEEKPAMPDLSDPNKPMSPEEIAALIANL